MPTTATSAHINTSTTIIPTKSGLKLLPPHCADVFFFSVHFYSNIWKLVQLDSIEMMKSPTPRPSSPYRRRRITWVILLMAAAFIFYASTHDTSFWSLPSYLKEVSFSSSVASKVGLEKAKAVNSERLRVQEIHGLLHFVTAYPNRRLNEEDGAINAVGLGLTKVDPTETVDLRVFSPDGEDDWQQYVKTLREKYPLIVFSKSYCP